MAKRNSNGDSPTYPRWSSWIDEIFNNDLPLFSSNFNSGMTLPKVNIKETQNAYVVEMAVPGLEKSNFNIDLDHKVLSISTELEENQEEQRNTYTRREFGYSTFKRSFALPESVNEDRIKAEYSNGVLSIHLPKKEEAIQKPARNIEIS